jgi:hypothetical protein
MQVCAYLERIKTCKLNLQPKHANMLTKPLSCDAGVRAYLERIKTYGGCSACCFVLVSTEKKLAGITISHLCTHLLLWNVQLRHDFLGEISCVFFPLFFSFSRLGVLYVERLQSLIPAQFLQSAPHIADGKYLNFFLLWYFIFSV